MNEEELRELLSKGESDTLEIKGIVPSSRQIATYIAAMANTEGGVLVLGVKLPDRIRGVDVKKAQAALDDAQRYLRPALPVDVEVVTVGEDSVVVIEISKTLHLISAAGGYYKRAGDKVRALSAAEIQVHARTGTDEHTVLLELSSALALQTQVIDDLRKDFARVNSLLHKAGWIVGGGVAGAVAKHFAELMFGR